MSKTVYTAKRPLAMVGLRPKVFSQRKLNQRQKRQVKRLISIRQEKKYFPFFLTAANVAASATVTDLSAISQGDGITARDGQECQIHKLEFRYTLTAADNHNTVRVMLIQWKNDTDADPPTSAKILQDEVNSPWLTDYNYTERKEFNVLYDKVHSMTLSGNGAISRRVFINPKKYKKTIIYNSNATTGSNKIYLLTISDSGAISHPTISMYGTITYTDS